jgi:hypothetical protein
MPKRRVLKKRNDEEEQQQQSTSNEPQQPPRKITQFVDGQQREYHFMKTVKSLEELDKIRFQV